MSAASQRLSSLSRQLPLLVLGALVFLCVLALALVLLEHHERYARELEQAGPRHARLEGLKAGAADVAAALDQAQGGLAQLAFPQSLDEAQSGTELQQMIRRRLDGLGLSLVSSQIMPVARQDGIAEVSVAVVVEGSLEQMQGLLLGLAQERPALAVKSLQLSPRVGRNAGPEAAGRLNARLTVAAMRIETL